MNGKRNRHGLDKRRGPKDHSNAEVEATGPKREATPPTSSKPLRIVIDMQGAQTESRFCDIGHYTLSFAQAVVRNQGKHEVFLALNGLFPETIEPIRATFANLLPQENIRVWYTLGPVKEREPGNEARRRVAELIREAFLASLRPDVIHICSIFEGYIDDAVTSIGRFDRVTPVTASVFELPVPDDRVEHELWVQHKLETLSQTAACFITAELERQKRIADITTSVILETQLCQQGNWDTLAYLAFKRWESIAQAARNGIYRKITTRQRRRLAFVSPLPPERTGIADYSAELLPALSEHYEIEVVVAQNQVTDPWVNKHLKVRDVEWLKSHVNEIDRVLYHIGNSPFHAHMLPLLQEVPGVVVLHDFFLGHLWRWMDHHVAQGSWAKELYSNHGYSSLITCYKAPKEAIFGFPCSFTVIKNAQGIIVHSEFSRQMAGIWYGNKISNECSVIPHLRFIANIFDKNAARQELGIKEEDFVVCSFGLLGETKLNHRLLESWLASALAHDHRCHLIFVGENDCGDYGASLLQAIGASNLGKRMRITGFATPKLFRQYLMAADLAVQLRTQSRGETSGTVLDCMSHGMPVITNASGAMAELDREALWMLPEEFTDIMLIRALETLWRKPDLRRTLGGCARNIILDRHAPEKCARRYAEAIEYYQRRAEMSSKNLVRAITKHGGNSFNNIELMHLAKSIAVTLPQAQPAKRILLDVTVTCQDDYKTGIQRVVRAILLELLKNAIPGWIIEAVYLTEANKEWHYRNASKYVLSLLGYPPHLLDEVVLEPQTGDLLLVLDLTGSYLINAEESGLYSRYRCRGVKVFSVVYDILPIRAPEFFPPYACTEHEKWAKCVSTFDGAVCISKAVADDLAQWQDEVGLGLKDRRPYQIGWFHLGADVSNSAPSQGLPNDTEATLTKLKARPSFLMVGTIEPRKAYLQAIEAFEHLWKEAIHVNLVIVGKEGWKRLPEEMRRNIPETVQRLRSHPKLNKCLFWLEDISDEYLEKVYAAGTCLIAASHDEGFGLPLIEAAQHNLAIIARDIPVFREVAREHAYYFNAKSSEGLAKTIKAWLRLYYSNQHPRSEKIQCLTWKESAQRLLEVLLPNG